MKLTRVDRYRVRIEKAGRMRVPGMVFASSSGLDTIRSDKSLEQVVNVAHLPGIRGRSLAMPDIHWGYGFPIGGVAAMEVEDGVISPGGVGYDINCGVRLAVTEISRDDLERSKEALAEVLFRTIPCGVGGGGDFNLTGGEMEELLTEGASWTVRRGYGTADDLRRTEEEGALSSADPDAVSPRAIERGKTQLGTLGSGNHFLEIAFVEKIYDSRCAAAFGLREGAVTVMIHCGSRGLGHQVCTDFLRVMQGAKGRERIELPDRQLACVPIRSSAGQRYLAAMAAAANFAWANRQYLQFLAGRVLQSLFGTGNLRLVYDVSHNIAKMEEHKVGNQLCSLCVHRKGATRAFPPGHPDVTEEYREVGQPVLIPGNMRSGSYVLAGTERAMTEAFGSTCHGAGRAMSRSAARREIRIDQMEREMRGAGVVCRARSRKLLVEEAPAAYKDIDSVVDVVHGAGISKKVARLKPMVVIKG